MSSSQLMVTLSGFLAPRRHLTGKKRVVLISGSVYSVMDSLEIARKNPDKKIVFLGIGFETTSPASAAAILGAYHQNISNFLLFSSHKIMPPAMAALIDEGVKINGYIAPGHVSTITGTSIYQDIAEKYHLGCVIAGFEPVDLMESILMLVRQFENNQPKVEIQYRRAVRPEGNIKGQGNAGGSI